MALSDPELELLSELLKEDPGDDAFMQVGEEYVRRELWPEAVRVLAGGLDARPDARGGWALMFEASVQAGQFLRALSAWEKLTMFERESGPLRKLRVRALSMSGQIDFALDAGESYLRDIGFDQEIWDLIERLQAPPSEEERRGVDPFVTVERAEEFVVIGRPDRAVRMYRRLLHRHPQAVSIARRLRELQNQPVDAYDDLSEELTGEVPLDYARPPIDMPTPNINAPMAGVRSAHGLDVPVYGGPGDEDIQDEPTASDLPSDADESTDTGAAEDGVAAEDGLEDASDEPTMRADQPGDDTPPSPPEDPEDPPSVEQANFGRGAGSAADSAELDPDEEDSEITDLAALEREAGVFKGGSGAHDAPDTKHAGKGAKRKGRKRRSLLKKK